MQAQEKALKAEDLSIDEEYAALIPHANWLEFPALRESIQRHGQRDPIVVSKTGKVLDGLSRFKACQELKVKPLFVVKDFAGKDAERTFIVEAALIRRNLNEFQKVEAAQFLYSLEKKKARERQKTGGKPSASKDAEVGKAARIVAARIGVSTATFERACFILAHADQGELWELEGGTKTIGRVYQKLKKKEDHYRVVQESTFKTNNKVLLTLPSNVADAARSSNASRGAAEGSFDQVGQQKVQSRTCCCCQRSFPEQEVLFICGACASAVQEKTLH